MCVRSDGIDGQIADTLVFMDDAEVRSVTVEILAIAEELDRTARSAR